MTRDYAKKNSHRKRPNARRSPAKKQAAPGWLWLLAGILVGALFASLLQLSRTPDATTDPEQPEAASEQGEAPDSKPRFDFYTLLRESEVIVPDSPKPQTGEKQTAPEPEVAADEVFLLQVGSFKSSSDADSLRARLLLLNLNASIETVSPKGETWHRVIVGPFTSRGDVSNARNRLSSNGIDSLLLKRRQ